MYDSIDGCQWSAAKTVDDDGYDYDDGDGCVRWWGWDAMLRFLLSIYFALSHVVASHLVYPMDSLAFAFF